MNEDLVQEVKAVHDERLAAFKTGNAQKFGQLVADDLVYISSMGMLRNKPEILAELASGDLNILSIQTEDLNVSVYEGTAVATYRTEMAASFRGQDRGGRFRTTAIYSKHRGRWELVLQQLTRITLPG